jgi:FAS-associated factor 2
MPYRQGSTKLEKLEAYLVNVKQINVFYRYTLPHPEVISYINSNMLFWACSVTTSEGYRVSQALRENGYPFLAVIVLHDGRMSVVGR